MDTIASKITQLWTYSSSQRNCFLCSRKQFSDVHEDYKTACLLIIVIHLIVFIGLLFIFYLFKHLGCPVSFKLFKYLCIILYHFIFIYLFIFTACLKVHLQVWTNSLCIPFSRCRHHNRVRTSKWSITVYMQISNINVNCLNLYFHLYYKALTDYSAQRSCCMKI